MSVIVPACLKAHYHTRSLFTRMSHDIACWLLDRLKLGLTPASEKEDLDLVQSLNESASAQGAADSDVPMLPLSKNGAAKIDRALGRELVELVDFGVSCLRQVNKMAAYNQLLEF